MRRALMTIAMLALLAARTVAAADDVPPGEVRLERDRATIRVSDEPLYRLLARLTAESRATIAGAVPVRKVTVDLVNVPLAEALTTILGSESFMLTYAADGTLRTLQVLAAGAPSSPTPLGSPSPRPPLAEEEAQATILQRTVPVTGPLARAVQSEQPAIGRLLHAAVQEPRPSVRGEAQEAVLTAFANDPEAEAAYLSTLTPIDDTVLARILRSSSKDGAAEEWMAALSTRAPSPALRAKATAVLTALQRLPR